MTYEERAYQTEVVTACVHHFVDEKIDSVMIEAPVGSGKTIMALRVIDELQRRFNRVLKVDWVAPRHHLLEQVMETNRDFRQAVIRPVTLFEKDPPPADLVVLDEAHHEATRSCVMLYDRIAAPLTLGISATPLRTDRMRLSFKTTVNSCGIRRLIADGWLSPFHSYMLPHYDARIVAATYLSAPGHWGKSVAFFETIKACELFRDQLAAGGVACEIVTGDSDKDSQLDAFRKDEIRVVANAQMLAEGFDLPDLNTVFVRDASRLPTIQMCGRALRRCPGKDHCNIVQSSNTKYPFERVAAPENAFRFTNGHWLALTDKTREISAAIEETIRRIGLKEVRKKKADQARCATALYAFETTAPLERLKRSRTGSPKNFYAMNHDLYALLYHGYEAINQACWDGTLPQVVLGCNFPLRRTRVLAFAMNGVSRDSTGATAPLHRIAFNVSPIIGLHDFETGFWTVFLHEMTHIWQYSQGRRGGHGKDFYAEEKRAGYDEKAKCIQAGSRFASILPMLQRQSSAIFDRFYFLIRHAPPTHHDHSVLGDIKFFRAFRHTPPT